MSCTPKAIWLTPGLREQVDRMDDPLMQHLTIGLQHGAQLRLRGEGRARQLLDLVVRAQPLPVDGRAAVAGEEMERMVCTTSPVAERGRLSGIDAGGVKVSLAVTRKMISRTSMMSTSGVTLMPAMGPCPWLLCAAKWIAYRSVAGWRFARGEAMTPSSALRCARRRLDSASELAMIPWMRRLKKL